MCAHGALPPLQGASKARAHTFLETYWPLQQLPSKAYIQCCWQSWPWERHKLTSQCQRSLALWACSCCSLDGLFLRCQLLMSFAACLYQCYLSSLLLCAAIIVAIAVEGSAAFVVGALDIRAAPTKMHLQKGHFLTLHFPPFKALLFLCVCFLFNQVRVW